jgi:hypothetical protein
VDQWEAAPSYHVTYLFHHVIRMEPQTFRVQKVGGKEKATLLMDWFVGLIAGRTKLFTISDPFLDLLLSLLRG